MDPSQFAGMSWDVWDNHVENQHKGEFVKIDRNVNKLQREDLKIYGLIVDSEPLNVVVCEKCGLLVKSQALLQHYARKHSENSNKESSPKTLETEDSSFETSLVTSFSGNLVVKDSECDSASIAGIASENVKGKNKFASLSLTALRHVKRLENRSPLGQMCANRYSIKRKDIRVKSKSKDTISPLLSEKMKSGHISNDQKYGEDNLLYQLPALTLEEQSCVLEKPTVSVPFLLRPPRPLSEPPLFTCHKAGGLLHLGKQMAVTRQLFQQTLNCKMRSANLFQQIKARRKNPFNRKKK